MRNSNKKIKIRRKLPTFRIPFTFASSSLTSSWNRVGSLRKRSLVVTKWNGSHSKTLKGNICNIVFATEIIQIW